MAKFLFHVGHFAAKHRFLVLLVWICIAAGIGALVSRIGADTNDNLSLPGTGSQEAADLLADEFPPQQNGQSPIVFKVKSGKVSDSANKTAIENSYKAIEKVPHVFSATDPFSQAGAAQISKDEKTAYIPVLLDIGASDLTEEEAQAVLDAADPAEKAGMQVAAGGPIGTELSTPETESSEVIGIVAAMIILTFAFGTIVAMGMPILTAIIGLSAGLGLIGLLGHVVQVPSIAPTLATMIGLGVGIDYALFVVMRHLRNVRDGMEIRESIARTIATTGTAIVFAGTTVVVALLALAVAGIPLVTSLGYSSAVAVVTAVLAAVTLMPALLSLVGHKVLSLALPRFLRPKPKEPGKGFWAGWARNVTDHPWLAVLVAVAILVPLTIPLFSLELGQEDIGATPKSTQERQAYDLMAAGFGPGYNGPFLIAVELDPAATTDPIDPRLVALQDALTDTDGVQALSPPLVNKSGSAAIFSLIPTTAPADEETADLVVTLRDTVIPDALATSMGIQAFVGGSTAGNVDLAAEITSKLPLVIITVLALSVIVLLLAFRSVLVPLQAALTNVVCVGASFGVLTACFQWGWGLELVGIDVASGTDPIASYVPLMMFAVLFGLSMDYQVFLLSQVDQHRAEGESDHDAVRSGLALSARVITAAALIMIFVFGSFILNGDPVVKQFGVGLAVAVALAGVMVMLLSPAIMVLLGRGTWWLPRWLDHLLPNMDIEGEAFRKSQAPAAEPAPVPTQTGGS